MKTEIIDKISGLSDNYTPGRAGFKVCAIVLHTTAGPGDDNSASFAQVQSREQATINWLLTGAASVHYMVGPEITGAKIYRLCREEDTAWHAAGWPTRNVFVAPDGTRLEGSVDGVSKVNCGSIGIERWGRVGESVGAAQRATLIDLVTDIARRYSLKSQQVISHQWLQTDRSDGNEVLSECRAAVAAMWNVPNSPPVTNPNEELLNGFTLRGEIRQHWKNYGGLIAFGYPLSNEFVDPTSGLTTQVFEREVLQFFPQNQAPYRVQGLQLGREWLAARPNIVK